MPAPVKALNHRSDGRWDVHTDHGIIKAKHVVNAAGTLNLLDSLCLSVGLKEFACSTQPFTSSVL